MNCWEKNNPIDHFSHNLETLLHMQRTSTGKLIVLLHGLRQ